MTRIKPAGKISAPQISTQRELTKGTVVKQQIGLVPTRQEVQRRAPQPSIVPQLTQEEIDLIEQETNKYEAAVAAKAAADREADLWARAESLVRRKGKAAAYIAKGSNISDKVRQLLGGMSAEESFAAFAGVTPMFGSGRTVAEVQAQAKLAESVKEYAGISGKDFTPAQEIEALRKFTVLQKEIKQVELGAISRESFIASKTPEEVSFLKEKGVIVDKPVLDKTESYISAYVPPTTAQQEQFRIYRDIAPLNIPGVTKPLSVIKEQFKETPTRSQYDIFKETFSIVPTTSISGDKSTASYEPTKYEDLSPEAKLLRTTTPIEITEQFKLGIELEKEKQRLTTAVELGLKSPEIANIELKQIALSKSQQYSGAATKRIEAEQFKISREGKWDLGFLPTPTYKKFEFEKRFYESGITGTTWRVYAKSLTAGASFGVGAYKGIKYESKDILKNVAIGTAITVATAGAGAAPTALGYLAKTISTVSKGLKVAGYGLGATYGVSVAGRTLLSPSPFETLGKITSTEILAFGVGRKLGSKLYQPSVYAREKVPGFDKEQLALEKSFRILKKEKLEIKNIRWDRIKEIPKDPKLHNVLEQFMIKKNLILGGTSAIETGSIAGSKSLGINLRRLPRDVEAYANLDKVSKSALYKDLGFRLKTAGIKDYKVTREGVIFGGKGHGFNIQDIKKINLERFRWKIYKTPSGVSVADPLATGYNKVYDLLKGAKLGTPRAKAIIKKLGSPEMIRKGTASGMIFERYPKDVIGALSTSKSLTGQAIGKYQDFSKPQLPGYQEWRLLRLGQAKQLIKPYLGKLKYEEAPAIADYFKGKPAGFFSGAGDVKSYTLYIKKMLLQSKKASLGGFGDYSSGSPYKYIGGKKIPILFYAIKDDKIQESPYPKYDYKSTIKQQTYLPSKTYQSQKYVPSLKPTSTFYQTAKKPTMQYPIASPKLSVQPYIPYTPVRKTPGGGYDYKKVIDPTTTQYTDKKVVPPFMRRTEQRPSRELYKTFIIKGGKKQYLSGLLPKGLAKQKGSTVTLKTLRATFGVEATGQKTRMRDVLFEPDKEVFRSYRIKKEKRKPLKDIYIERRSKRLSVFGEVQEIQLARKKKRNPNGFLIGV